MLLKIENNFIIYTLLLRLIFISIMYRYSEILFLTYTTPDEML